MPGPTPCGTTTDSLDAKRSEKAFRRAAPPRRLQGVAGGCRGCRGCTAAPKRPQLCSGADRATVRKRGGRPPRAEGGTPPPQPGRKVWPSLAESDRAGALLAREGRLHDHLLPRHLCQTQARYGCPARPERLIGRGWREPGAACACSGADRSLRGASWPTCVPPCHRRRWNYPASRDDVEGGAADVPLSSRLWKVTLTLTLTLTLPLTPTLTPTPTLTLTVNLTTDYRL